MFLHVSVLRYIRPAELTTLKVGITVIHIEVDENKNLFTVNGWTNMEWSDDRLKWNSSQFGGKTVMHLMDHEIW